ncbi:type II toxin-antitoxin system VapC family toxin [Rugamonas sp.]|uniref:type II toxin-antitoxin system VapC family toxin n=1 Tax=Rugamonas sp. TaxID=1926287 RepID=UPI0025D344E7|nr:type II toxin-antitoxin system VapC family toxin [Rugamonas sp.]
MALFLVDTNVISEARKGRKSNAGVQDFFRSESAGTLFLSAQTIGEIRRGIENLRCRRDLSQVRALELWLDFLLKEYADRILAFDLECAQHWGRLMSPDAAHAVDKQIAAIALMYDMTIVTRNVGDFRDAHVRVQNPFA